MIEMRSFQKIGALFVAFAVISGVSGCVTIGAEGSSRTLYDLSFSAPKAVEPEQKRGEILLIRGVQGLGLTTTPKILYRPDARTLSHYQFSQWVQPPTLLIENGIIASFQRAGLFSAVSRSTNSIIGDVQLNLELRDFSVHRTGDDLIAVLVLEADYLDLRTHRLIAQREFIRREKIAEESPEGVVLGLEQAANSAVSELLAWVQSGGQSLTSEDSRKDLPVEEVSSSGGSVASAVD